MNSSQNLPSLVFRAVVILLLLSAGLLSAIWLFSTSPVPPSSVRPEVRRTVEVVEVELVEVIRPWVGYGLSKAASSIDVSAEVPSIVAELPPQILAGAPVVSGQLLATLDADDFRRQHEIAERALQEISTRRQQLQIDEANATRLVELGEEDVRIVRDELERIQVARDKGAANPREVDLVRQRLVQSETALTTARTQLDGIPVARRMLNNQEASQIASRDLALSNVERCSITSAIDGVLESVDVELGERVAPGQRLARIVNLDLIDVEVRLPSSARSSVSVGNEVTLSAQGAEERSWNGLVTRISPVDDPASRTMMVIVEIRQTASDPSLASEILAPGTFLSARVQSTYSANRIVLPSSSVKNDRVWIIDRENRIRTLPVEVAFPIQLEGTRKNRHLVLDSELPPGTRVLVQADQSPSIGTEVDFKVIKDGAPDSSGAGS
ncbi:MAG: efflux RND transporter periplasmic adaptor subunit [Planctomycetota bacterium]|nr:efflux RND transporter periplasmic adaptor subunit [Planctomycetota bacterium]